MNKYFIAFLGIFSALFIFVLTDQDTSSVNAHTSGGDAGTSGSPGDGKNCTSCHSGTATSQNGLITSTIPAVGYTPGAVYTVTASITNSSITKFGFEVSPQNAAGSRKGSMKITNSSETQLVGSGKYVTHKTAGTPGSSGTKTWTFDWTAPIAGTGDLTFYGAFNCTNSDNSSGGDIIILSQLPVHENLTTGVHEPLAERYVKVFPNPASSWINISSNPDMTINEIKVFDLTGKLVLQETINYNDLVKIDIHSLKAGVYILQMNTDTESITEKIIVS